VNPLTTCCLSLRVGGRIDHEPCTLDDRAGAAGVVGLDGMQLLWNTPLRRLKMAFFAHNKSGGDDAEAKSPLLQPLLPPEPTAVLGQYDWGSCAVVGNSGGLTVGAAYGAAIDSHATVLRLNQVRSPGL